MKDKILYIYSNGVLMNLVMRVPIYLNFTLKAERLVYTRCGIRADLKKANFTRYSSHRRLDTDHPALLLVVVAQFKILLVTDDTIFTHFGITHLPYVYHSNTEAFGKFRLKRVALTFKGHQSIARYGFDTLTRFGE